MEKVLVIQMGAFLIFIVGFVASTVAEIFLLKKKGWLDEKLVWRYPIITNLVNIPVAAIAYFAIIWVLFVVAFIVMGTINLKFEKDYPNLVEVAGIIFYIFAFVVPLIGYLATFTLVRQITTNIMAKSSNLTWKYKVGQSAILTVLLMIVSFLFTSTFYMLNG